MKYLFLGMFLFPTFLNAQLEKFEFWQLEDGRHMAYTYIEPDSILQHNELLIFPFSATNNEKKGCLCSVLADSLKLNLAINCGLPKDKIYRMVETNKERAYILSRILEYALCEKKIYPRVFYWTGQ